MEDVLIFILFFMSIVAHEVAHGWTAFQLGDPTAYQQNRLTFNPLVHIDPFMTILLPIISFTAFGFPFGGAKPVPVNPFRFRNPDKGMMITSIAGPATNIMIGLFFTILIIVLMPIIKIGSFAFNVFFLASFLNYFLAAFNLMPIPPLDGSRFVRYFLPENIQREYDKLERFGILIVMFLIVILNRQFSGFMSSAYKWYLEYLISLKG